MINISLEDVGRPVIVQCRDRRRVEGWLFGVITQGLLVSDDVDGKQIRLVRDAERLTYGVKPIARFVKHNLHDAHQRIHNLEQKIRTPMERAVARLSFRFLQRFVDRAPELKHELLHLRHASYSRLEDTPLDMALNLRTAMFVDELIDLHIDVFPEFVDSGIADVVSENSDEFVNIPPEYSMPDLDATAFDEVEFEAEPTPRARWSLRRHREQIEEVRSLRGEILTRSLFSMRRKGERGEDKRGRPRGASLRYIGAGVQIFVGTGLTVANTGLGLTAGLTTTIATIGATMVPTYVGVCASICTGLAQVGDGLGKLGQIRKDGG